MTEDIFDLSIPFYKEKSPVREAWLATYWDVKEYSSAPSSFSLLHLASFFGIVPLTRKLLRKGWKILLSPYSYVNKRDSRGWTPLSYAAENGHEAVVKLLLEKGAELETKDLHYGRTPLLYAARNGHEAVVKLLLEKGAELETKNDAYGGTPLSYAAENGHEAVVKLLLEKGAELENKDT